MSCLLAAPLCLAGPTSPLLTLWVTCCQEAPLCTAPRFVFTSDCYLLLLCSPPCKVETTDCRRNKGVSSAGRQWDA